MKKHHDANLDHSATSVSILSALAQDCTTRSTGILTHQPVLLMAMDSFLRDVRKIKITLSALHLLITLFHLKKNTAKLSKLAEAIGVSSAGVTGVVDNLARMGLAVRVTDPKDRRAILMKLTPQGVDFAQDLENSLASSLGRAFFGKVSQGIDRG